MTTISVALGQAIDTEKPKDPKALLRELDWLAGEWKGPMWGGEFVAFYSTPKSGKILSHSKLIKDGQVAFYEFEVFEPHEHVLLLRPYPRGKAAATFTFKQHDRKGRKLVFENPDKDYPTRIEYHRVSDQNLVITLSDPFGKSGKVERFDLRAVSNGD